MCKVYPRFACDFEKQESSKMYSTLYFGIALYDNAGAGKSLTKRASTREFKLPNYVFNKSVPWSLKLHGQVQTIFNMYVMWLFLWHSVYSAWPLDHAALQKFSISQIRRLHF